MTGDIGDSMIVRFEGKSRAESKVIPRNLTDHPTPMTEKNYRMINLKFSNAVRAVAMRSMDEAAEEVRQTQTSNKDLILETGGSVDGTWQSWFQFTEWGCCCTQY